MFNKAWLSGKNSTVGPTQGRLSCHTDMAIHFNIAGHIFERIELKTRDGDWKTSKKFRKVLGGSLFLVTRRCSVVKTLLSQAKRETIERLF